MILVVSSHSASQHKVASTEFGLPSPLFTYLQFTSRAYPQTAAGKQHRKLSPTLSHYTYGSIFTFASLPNQLSSPPQPVRVSNGPGPPPHSPSTHTNNRQNIGLPPQHRTQTLGFQLPDPPISVKSRTMARDPQLLHADASSVASSNNLFADRITLPYLPCCSFGLI